MFSVVDMGEGSAPALPSPDSAIGALIQLVVRVERRVGALEDWRDGTGEYADGADEPTVPAASPEPERRSTVATPVDVDKLAHASIEDWQRAIGARHGCNASSLRDALVNSPRFAHWRQLARSNVCRQSCSGSACADRTSVTGCRMALRLLAAPYGTYTTRYSAIMAGEVDAHLTT